MANVFKKLVKKIGSTKNRGRLKKQFLLVITLIILLFSLDVGPAHAETLGETIFGGIAFSVVSNVVLFFSSIIALIAGLFIAIEAWMIGILLTISSHIVDSPAVQAGFPITLSVANLGFVLGIIVIAIATILRYEQYGMKKILMKLVAAAILVNFSLVIAGVIINFSNQLTGFFLDSLGGPTKFASNIGDAFQPQRAFMYVNKDNKASPDDLKKLESALAPPGSGSSIGAVLAPLASLVFTVATLIVMIITLFALIIMLLIRYIFLGILLVLMPFAWLLWVFPAFQSQWSKWWHNFLRWTFFSPIVVFFLWLAFTAASTVNSSKGMFDFGSYGDTNGPYGAIAAILTIIFAPVVVNMMQVSIVVGLMIGGLFAANSFGITFASTAMGAVKSIGAGAGTWAGRLGARVATAPLRGERFGLKKLTNRLQQAGTGTGLGSRALRYTGVGYLTRLGGRGLENLGVAGGENLIKQYEKETAGLTKSQTINQLSSSSAPRRIALLEKAKKEGYLTLGDIPNLENYVGENQRNLFKRYGRENLLEESKNESGITLKNLVEQFNKAAGGPAKDAALDEIVKHFKGAPNPGALAETFFPNIEKLEARDKPLPGRLDKTLLFGIQEAIVRGVAKGFSPKNMSGFFDKLVKSDQLEAFSAAASRAKIKPEDLTESGRKYLESSPGARNQGIGLRTFGLEERQGGPSRLVDEFGRPI